MFCVILLAAAITEIGLSSNLFHRIQAFDKLHLLFQSFHRYCTSFPVNRFLIWVSVEDLISVYNERQPA